MVRPCIYTAISCIAVFNNLLGKALTTSKKIFNGPMSYLAYPPRLPVEFSESVTQLIKMTLKIKNEVVPHKNEFNESLATWGRAYMRPSEPLDARSCLLKRQIRKSRHWVAFTGEQPWGDVAEITSEEQLRLKMDGSTDPLFARLKIAEYECVEGEKVIHSGPSWTT